MAIRSASAFIFFKYSYTLFLYTTPYIAYSILLSGIYISPSRQAARFGQANYLFILPPGKGQDFLSWLARYITPASKSPRRHPAG